MLGQKLRLVVSLLTACSVVSCSKESTGPDEEAHTPLYSGVFSGYVWDAEDNPVAGAPVDLKSLTNDCNESQTQVFSGHQTTSTGWFRISFTPPVGGWYDGDCFRLTSSVEGLGTDTILIVVPKGPPGAMPNGVEVILKLR